MTSAKTDAELALQRAYDELAAAGGKITTRALRERARVDNNTATTWLRARRATDEPSSLVPDDIAAAMTQVLADRIVEPIWARSVKQARAEVAQRHADELLAAHDVTASARADAERTGKHADALQAKHDRLAEQLVTVEKALDDARLVQGQLLVDLDRAQTDCDSAREAAKDAERRASESAVAQLRAETELATLREVLAAFRPDRSTP